MKAKLEQAKELLSQSTRPLFLFDNDPDGLAAFLLLYRFVKAGKGIPLKGSVVDEAVLTKVHNYEPDLVVILDKPLVTQEFLSRLHCPSIWIDHHDMQSPKKTLYINPQEEKRQVPTSHLCYEITQQDIWLAVVGTVADWQLPEEHVLNTFNTTYPSLALPTDMDAPTALFSTTVGELARILSFSLKGKPTQVLTHMKILTRIDEPVELLGKKHSQAKLIMKNYEKHLDAYNALLSQIEVSNEEEMIVYTYTERTNSYTTDLSNELLYKYPNKVIVIGRVSGGSYKCSLRAAHLPLDQILQATINITGGSGGGHEHACGAIIQENKFEEFVTILHDQIQNFQTKDS